MNILFLLAAEGEEGNSASWRMMKPARAAAALGHGIRISRILDFARDNLSQEIIWADLIIWQRSLYPEAIGPLLLCKQLGKRVILDLDDAYPLMPQLTTGYAYWKEGILDGRRLPYDPLDLLKHTCKLVDLVTTPSPLLSEFYEQLASCKVAVVPNYPTCGDYLLGPEVDRVERIFWTGSKSHYSGLRFSPAIDALNRFCKHTPGITPWVYGDERVASLIKNARHVNYTTYDVYPATLAGMGQIGLAPLSGSYDLYRSDIKLLDLAGSGIPWIASREGPYLAWQGRPGGILCNNTQRDWHRAIESMVEEYPRYKREVREWRAGYFKEWDISYHIQEIIHIWEG